MDILKKNLEELALRAPGVSTAIAGAGTAGTGHVVPEDKLRFMLVGTHIHQVTGYSKVTYNMVRELAKMPNLQVIHYGFQKHNGQLQVTRKYPEGVVEIDAAATEPANVPGQPPANHGFGFVGIGGAIRKHKPHVVMIYNDFAVISGFLEAIQRSGVERNFQIWIYADQVYTIQQKPYLDNINREATRVFAFSDYWKDCLRKQGINRPIEVITHGFTATDFPVVPRAVARKAIGIPEEMFLYMSLNRNQPRKRLDLLVMAFVELIIKHPQKPIGLLMVADKGEKGGWNLFEIFARELQLRGASVEQFGNRLMITSKDMSYSDSEINMMMNAADVGVSCAEGEGWGLCSFEMMGVGKPQVLSDVGGHKDFCNAENSQLVKSRARYYLPACYCNLGGEAHVVEPHEVSVAMESYLMDSELLAKHGKAAREKVLTYTWENCMKQLTRRLARTWEDIKEGVEA
jgi:glycosyltransferase involved in cell wall biosynthesis